MNGRRCLIGIMDKRTILNELLLLSKRHLKLAIGERWKEWETVTEQKRLLYEKLLRGNGCSLDREEEKKLQAMAKLDRKTKAALEKRKKEIKEELAKISQLKCAFKGYRRTTKKVEGCHFNVTC